MNRIDEIINQVTKKECVVADIGSDHAFVALKLLDKGFVKTIYNVEINEIPLQNSINNTAAYLKTGTLPSPTISPATQPNLFILFHARDINRVGDIEQPRAPRNTRISPIDIFLIPIAIIAVIIPTKTEVMIIFLLSFL